ncbi:MAG TPA: EamA family transporter, partial [Acetobacteraceae bacterium]|nr:EamA family transporter [Acetobacteraceae bacterium]
MQNTSVTGGVKAAPHGVRLADVGGRVPPHVFFFASAVFHYLGPAFAVLLFAHVSVLGVAWLRIASTAAVFALWRRPWRSIAGLPRAQLRVLVSLGVVLGLMNVCFYQAIARLPLSTVGSIEFIGPVILAAFGARTPRNIAAFAFAACGGWVLTGVRLGGEPLGYLFAFANCGLFMLYVVLGHRIAQDGGAAGIDRLGAAMLIALVAVFPVGFGGALPALRQPYLLLAGVGVGVCSSVVPYVFDQLAMARLPRATFSLLLALLPATACVIGVVVLRQVPTAAEWVGILFVAGGVALHRECE